eukprot:jgi/Botrbrau1/10830/Bobra.0025s0009.1
MPPGLRPVTEDTRISITEQLEIFQRSPDIKLTFPPGLSNHDRAVVHAECKKYGFTSKSFGKGDARCVTIFKPQRSGASQADVYDLQFTPQSFQAYDAYFQRYPPTEGEMRAAQGEEAGPSVADPMAENQQYSKRRKAKAGQKAALFFTPEEVEARRRAWQQRLQAPGMRAITEGRAALPIAPFREEILGAVAGHQVTLIAGETGCGKTTQVPQYLLEDCWEKGRGCRIICTQPRRISAVSVSERVAAERGESIGDTVGYTIRLDSKGGPGSSLMFCTNGVLLRMLTHGDELTEVSHIIVDEIHERDKFADFLLIVLRDLLPSHPNLRLVLMSATLHTQLFSAYFGGCPIVQVPGFTYPVADVYLEDILSSLGYAEAVQNGGTLVKAPERGTGGPRINLSAERVAAIQEAIRLAFVEGGDKNFDGLMEATGAGTYDDAETETVKVAVNVAHPRTGATPLMAAAGMGRTAELEILLASGADPAMKSNDGQSALEWARTFGQPAAVTLLEEHATAMERANNAAVGAAALSAYQAAQAADEVDLQLIQTLLMYIYGEGQYAWDDSGSDNFGAVLVFLPGWDEIIRLKEKLEASPIFSSRRYLLLPLHSMVPPADQRRVFLRPPAGVRKVVLATNIAETAVTIDDIVCVINSGRMKEKSYDPYTAVSTLQETWTSKASEKQRRGRAGRCQQGVCFHLYSQQRSSRLTEFQMPELQRSPLDEMCLQVKLLGGSSAGEGGPNVAEFLGKAVEPPPDAAVRNALRLLEAIGALEEGTERLTVLGRHLAALPLQPAIGKMLLYGVLFKCLDPILTIACCMAYRDPWVLPIEATARRAADAAKQQLAANGGGASDHMALVGAFNGWASAKSVGQERGYAARNYLSSGTMMMIDGMRSQLLAELTSRGFFRSLEDVSVNARDNGLVRSVLACGFYPQVGRLLPSLRPVQGRPPGRRQAVILTPKEEKVTIHPRP